MHILPLIYAFVNLTILIVFLFFVLRKSVSLTLINRKENFIKKSKESQDYYHESINKLEEIKIKIANIDRDGQKYLETITENSKRMGEQMIENAKKMADVIIDDAGQLAEAEVRQTKNKIASTFVYKVINETRTKLEKDVNDGKRGEYIDEYSKLSKAERGLQ
ncbi:MAG: ATP synthase F0 subunit B [Proteobacteria bacterium]|nr:ATP synthase F0 subunit B [Pseudomonadota bacterium]